MFIRFQSRGGTSAPQDREQLEIDDQGTFSMWRSIVGNAPYPLDAVGHFVGQLDSSALAGLKSEVAAARSQGDLKKTPPRDAATTTVEIDGAKASLGSSDVADGDWGSLLAHLRSLEFELLRYPEAAIALELVNGGSAARLVYHGKVPIKVDLHNMVVRAVLWEGFTKRGDWRAANKPGESPIADLANSGWSVDLPFDHNFKVGPGQAIKAYVTFAIYDGDTRVPVSIVAI